MLTDVPYNQREGITLGTALDVCKDCLKEGKRKPGDLEYKEVFKIDNYGDSICLCMKHFEQKLGKYILVDSSSLDTDSEEEQETVQEEEKTTKKTPAKRTKKETDENVTDGKTTK